MLKLQHDIFGSGRVKEATQLALMEPNFLIACWEFPLPPQLSRATETSWTAVGSICEPSQLATRSRTASAADFEESSETPIRPTAFVPGWLTEEHQKEALHAWATSEERKRQPPELGSGKELISQYTWRTTGRAEVSEDTWVLPSHPPGTLTLAPESSSTGRVLNWKLGTGSRRLWLPKPPPKWRVALIVAQPLCDLRLLGDDWF
jgi:hypothetical protein